MVLTFVCDVDHKGAAIPSLADVLRLLKILAYSEKVGRKIHMSLAFSIAKLLEEVMEKIYMCINALTAEDRDGEKNIYYDRYRF